MKEQVQDNNLLQVRRDKLAALQQQGEDPFLITKYDQTHHTDEVKKQYEELEKQLLAGRKSPDVEGLDEQEAKQKLNDDYNERRAIMDASPVNVSVAGRMMFKRVMGKASFCNIRDLKGDIQVYVARDAIGEEPYAQFKKSDIGDIYGVKGYAFRTKTGEISIHATSLTLLSKSLQILPEKFHGLTDTDMRYRQRYVDLIMNQDVRETFVKRSLILKEIRRFLDGRGFMEVETPTLVSNAGGAAARPFETHFNALNEDMKLRISLELYLKRLIVGGLERVYEIGRVYRNEGIDARHNPEFTLMELYQAYTDYEGMMELTESMFRYLAQTVCGTTLIKYADKEIDLGKPFARMTMNEAILKYAGIDFDQVKTDEEAKALAKEHEIEFEERHTKGDIINLFFEEYCEANLIQPVFITDHPVEISPLTKKKPDDPSKVERFELFINTWEMCNAYSELNDPIDQRERFAQQDANAAAGDEEAQHTDEDFLNALEIGMPPTGGIGYGIDRLCMLLTDSAAIRDVLLFPTMKSLDGAKSENDAEETASSSDDKLKDAARKIADQADKWETVARDTAADAAEKLAGTADRLADVAKDTLANATTAFAGFADKILDALSGKPDAQDPVQTPEEPVKGSVNPEVETEPVDFSNVEIEPLFEESVDFETFSKSDFRAVKVKDCFAVPKSKKLLQFTLDDGTGTDRTILSGIHAFYEPEQLIGKTLVAITNLPPRKMMGVESCGMLLSALHTVNGEEKLNLLMVDDHIPAGAKLY